MQIHKIIFLFILAWFSIRAHAQPHEQDTGAHIVRVNATSGTVIPEITLRRHGIEAGPNRGILDVVVLKKGEAPQKSVRAKVDATYIDMVGRREEIPIREIVENDRVSYLGTFPIPRQTNVVRFEVNVKPISGDEAASLYFDERFISP